MTHRLDRFKRKPRIKISGIASTRGTLLCDESNIGITARDEFLYRDVKKSCAIETQWRAAEESINSSIGNYKSQNMGGKKEN